MRFTALVRLFGQPGLGDRAAHLFADKGHQSDFVRTVLMRVPVMDVDDADQFAGRDQRNRKERLVSIFRERLESFKSGIHRGVP